MARRSPSSTSTRSWRWSSEPEPWWQKSGRAWEQQNWWQERPRGWQDTSSRAHWHEAGGQDQSSSSGGASDQQWQDTRRWQSGRASADAGPALVRVRGEEERFLDSEVLRCPWPGPFTKSFPNKGEEGDWWATKELASSVGLVT